LFQSEQKHGLLEARTPLVKQLGAPSITDPGKEEDPVRAKGQSGAEPGTEVRSRDPGGGSDVFDGLRQSGILVTLG
jgi:hypothetical protein